MAKNGRKKDIYTSHKFDAPPSMFVLTRIEPNTKDHFPSQFLSSRDLTFRNTSDLLSSLLQWHDKLQCLFSYDIPK